ncbi:Pentatricopeptide repeat-containing protein [Frankliniella fusca]|uniref:Pentatricopeptide repeat-containing protein n=1 Tax=Frankliniella fusca TaxID=407009 RepID=A0AAE1LJZ6_9NEOP|nr:Pentatricopeptide repeat-containing protein [Frankliniella fusca]
MNWTQLQPLHTGQIFYYSLGRVQKRFDVKQIQSVVITTVLPLHSGCEHSYCLHGYEEVFSKLQVCRTSKVPIRDLIKHFSPELDVARCVEPFFRIKGYFIRGFRRDLSN